MDNSISEMNLQETLKTIKVLPNHIPVMLWGSPGIGKTRVFTTPLNRWVIV